MSPLEIPPEKWFASFNVPLVVGLSSHAGRDGDELKAPVSFVAVVFAVVTVRNEALMVDTVVFAVVTLRNEALIGGC
jgi:hypothetical protein